MRYRVIFTGRKLGAIGVWGFHVVDVEADSPEAAVLKCYDTHEHIQAPRVLTLEGATCSK